MAEVLSTRNLGGLPITSPQDTEVRINALLYGVPGSGKTTLAASASAVESMSPVLLLDVEGGTLSIRKRYPNIDVIRIRSFNDLSHVYGELKAQGEALHYKTIILDSLTEIQKFGMYEIMRRAVAAAEEKGEVRDPDLPGIGEWGKNTEQIRKLVRAFRDLPCHTIFCALAAQEKKGRDGLRAIPQLSGKLSTEIGGFMDLVFFLYLKTDNDETRRFILTQGTEDIIAKDRSDSMPQYIESPTMQELSEIVIN